MVSTFAIGPGGRGVGRSAGLLALAAVVSAGLTASAQRPTFKVKVDLVQVDVSVTRGNVPVGGLTAADFEVRDDGVKQKLEPLVAEEVPIEAWLVLDTSANVGPRLGELVQAATSFVDGLKPRDRAALIAFSSSVLVRQPPTSNLAELRGALASLTTTPQGHNALLDATYVALRLRQPGTTRGVAVVFTSGMDNLSWLSSARVVESARRSDVAFYGIAFGYGRPIPVSPFSPGPSPGAPWHRHVEDLAELTGGRVFDPTSPGLNGAFASILENIRARYVLSYYPTSTTPGWHELDVRLARGKGDVRARRGYWVEKRGPR